MQPRPAHQAPHEVGEGWFDIDGIRDGSGTRMLNLLLLPWASRTTDAFSSAWG
jgi:hypothetical protein